MVRLATIVLAALFCGQRLKSLGITAVIAAVAFLVATPGTGVAQPSQWECNYYSSQEEAQAIFEWHGGIDFDIYALDPDEDGIACELGLENVGPNSTQSEISHYQCEEDGWQLFEIGRQTGFESVTSEESERLPPDKKAAYDEWRQAMLDHYEYCWNLPGPLMFSIIDCMVLYQTLLGIADDMGLPLTQLEYDSLPDTEKQRIETFEEFLREIQANCFSFTLVLD